MDLLDGLPADVALWPAEFAGLGEGARREVAEWLAREWRQGRLEPRLLGAPPTAARLTTLRRALAAALDPIIAYPTADEHLPAPDEGTTRRWCWIASWVAMEQDEDLLFMGEAHRVPLLEEAAQGCPKRDYAIGIVAHDIRDHVFAALFDGPDAVRASLAQAAALIPAARAARADALVGYLERLAAWERPQRVDHAGAVARRMDVNRCHAPAAVDVVQAGDAWRSPLDDHGERGSYVMIDRRTGAIWAERPARPGAPRRKPRASR